MPFRIDIMILALRTHNVNLFFYVSQASYSEDQLAGKSTAPHYTSIMKALART
jgi:hypothetical protein